MTTPKGSELQMSEIPGLDAQIETLLSCKPLPELQVKQLCERVSNHQNFAKKATTFH